MWATEWDTSFAVRKFARNTRVNVLTSVNGSKGNFALTKYPSLLPTSLAALNEHIRRASYVAGHIWGSACNLQGTMISPERWGWTLVDREWKALWTKLDCVWQAVRAPTGAAVVRIEKLGVVFVGALGSRARLHAKKACSTVHNKA